jgi:tetratricopeptide (TPR) repeat protein
MKSLSHEDKHHLEAAEGWLGLGDHLSANEELDQIATELKAHPRVLGVRLIIYLKVKNWEAVVDIASALATLKPDNAHGWICRSFALHELKQTQEAYDLLLPAKDKFPKNLTVPYNLACYCSQLNRLDEAQDWFKKAMAINEQIVKRMAIDDPDLKPLWDSMSGTMWKRE